MKNSMVLTEHQYRFLTVLSNQIKGIQKRHDGRISEETNHSMNGVLRFMEGIMKYREYDEEEAELLNMLRDVRLQLNEIEQKYKHLA